MRTFISEFLTTPFLNQEISKNIFPYFLFEEILNKAKFEEKEIDLVYFFGIKYREIRRLFAKNNCSYLFFENSTSSIISNFISAIEILKTNKANAILFISANEKKVKNPFINQKNNYLKVAKRFKINKMLLDEILIKSYFKYEQFFSNEIYKEIFQPVVINKEKTEIYVKDNFFLKGISREILNLTKLISEDPWEIFSNYHFAESATGGCGLLLINEEVLNDKKLKNLCEICFFDLIKMHRVGFPINLIETLRLIKEFSFRTVFCATPCIIEEALVRGFFSDFGLHKEYLGTSINIDEINPIGSDLFWGWAGGTNFLRRLGLLKSYLSEKKGNGLLIEKIFSGPDFLLELLGL